MVFAGSYGRAKSTVSTICQAIVAEYDAWSRRDLTGIELDYLFLDASHFKMHDGRRAEPVLAAWGITTEGKPVFIGLSAAAAEPFSLCTSSNQQKERYNIQ
ncbi:transposase [Nonomuraea sp. NPDC049152]|uniref:transposase n=1 Tax=Nonomuraea sp. NPDC049152 TaxID=3154350 RepID=UPI003410CE15